MIYRLMTAAAFIYVLTYVFPVHAYTTADDVLSGRYADDGQNFLDRNTQQEIHFDINTGENTTIPRDSVTTCSGGICVNRSIKPDPENCPKGQVLVKMLKYGNRSAVCVPE